MYARGSHEFYLSSLEAGGVNPPADKSCLLGMQLAISSSSCCRSTLVRTLEDNKVVDNMVLVHSNVVLVGSMDRSYRVRSSSWLKKEP